MIKNSIEIKAEPDVIEVDELCTFLKNEAKNDGFGLLLIESQNKFLIFALADAVTTPMTSEKG